MPLRDDVEATQRRVTTALSLAHDHFVYSQQLWKRSLVVGKVRGSGRTRLVNRVTKSRAEGVFLEIAVDQALGLYLPTAAIGQIVSLTEAFVVDLVRLWVTAHPFHLRGTPVDVELIVSAADKPAILRTLADRHVASLSYKTPREWFKQLNTMVTLGSPTDAEVDGFAELKATRDVFVHSSGIANEIYLRKAGTLARATVGDPLDLPDAYVHDAYRLCHALVTDVGTAAAARA